MSRFAQVLLAAFLALAAFASARANGGVVSAATPEAAAAGAAILDAGGNAIDAAVAVSFALAVTEPAMSGLGGQTQMLVHPPGEPPFMINGTSYSPTNVPDAPTREQLRQGHTATTIPATVRVLDFAWRTYGGGVSWADVLAPAIRYAEEGFEVGPFRDLVYRRHEADLQTDPAVASLFLRSDSRAPRAGDTLVQPVLAQTLRRLAEHGGMDFYTGAIAEEIAADMAANGGWITLEDLNATPEPRVGAPLTTRYRNYDVHSLTPPAGGWVILYALNILEMTDPEILDEEDDGRASALLAALRLAHREREANPIEDLVDYSADAAGRLDKDAARAALDQARNPDRGETTHFSVVDGEGLAVSVTASIDSYFGAKRASPSLGFLYNNYMQAFRTDEADHPFALRPRAMPYSSMGATIIAQDGSPKLVLGSPGSARIVSAVTQVTSHWIDVGAGVEAAVDAPRVHIVPNEEGADAAYIEATPISGDLLASLAANDLILARAAPDLARQGRDPYFGGVHAIAWEHGAWRGAADPRRDGAVAYAGKE